LWFRITSSSREVRMWSRSAVANSWHCERIACNVESRGAFYEDCYIHSIYLIYNSIKKYSSIYELLLTLYSALNSFSILLSRLSSHDNSKAVSKGSLDDSDINEGDVSARYASILDRECLRESISRDVTHSSHAHLPAH
jgi:hypothetical protein